MKICTNPDCKQQNPQPLSSFNRNKNMPDGLQYWCRPCGNKQSKKWRNNNLEKAHKQSIQWNRNNPEKIKGHGLKKFWPGTTWQEALNNYNSLLELQNYVCAGCNRPETIKRKNGKIRDLCVDHCHTTGKVRGLLCDNCNKCFGLLKENIETIKGLLRYAEKHS